MQLNFGLYMFQDAMIKDQQLMLQFVIYFRRLPVSTIYFGKTRTVGMKSLKTKNKIKTKQNFGF